MDFFADMAHEVARFMRQHLSEVSFAMVSAVIFIFGGDLNNFIKKSLSKQHFIVRLLVFIIVAAFGYGALTVCLAALLARILSGMDEVALALVLAGFAVIIGIIAERRGQM